ncbi:MAG TPA: DNA polymerase I [Polyangia bacterium]
MNGTLFVVDALNYLFRAFHALPGLTTKTGQPTGAVFGFCQMLLRIDRDHQPTHMCVVFDAPGPTFRDELYKDYKANRPPAPPDLIAQIDLAHQVADAFGYKVLSLAGVEADDVIATLVRSAQAEKLSVVIGSSDKDLMQLCTEDVKLLDAMKNRLMGPAEVKEKWGVLPELLGDVLALMGDSVDNVPGVPGIGPKTAAELITTYGSLDGILANVEKIKGKKGQAIAESSSKLALSRELVRLRDDVALPLTMAELRRTPASVEKLRGLFAQLEFGRLLAQYSEAEVTHAPTRVDPVQANAPETAASGSPEPAAQQAHVVTDATALAELVSAVRLAKECAIAVLCDSGSAVRAGIVGFAFALPAGPRFYVPVKQQVLGAAPSLSEAEVLSGLAELFASEEVSKHVHDVKMLDVLLRVRGGRLAGVASDTMLAGYVLDAASADYDLSVLSTKENIKGVVPRMAWPGSGRAGIDAASMPFDDIAAHLTAEASATLALSRRQQENLALSNQEHLYRDLELALVPVLAAMECLGIRLDSDYLRNLGNEVAISTRTLESEIHALSGVEFNIASPKQLAEILFTKLGLPIIKKTKTGASTDADVLEELAAIHPLPAKILEYRTLTKLKGTYIDALPALVNPRTGRLHTTFGQAVAATGRLSSSDPNLQNIPIRSEIGKKIRHAFVADPGFHMLSADYSQIELRVLAHFSQDPAFLDAFRAGVDIHRRTAAEVFGVAETEVSAEQRRIAKAINFGLVFGQTDFGLAQVLHIPRAEAHKYIETYFKRYARVREHMDAMIAEARRTHSVSTLLGRTRALPEINAKRPQERNYAERIARNTPIQGSAADILKLAMLRVARGLSRFPEVRLLLTVHDELVCEVPQSQLDEFSPWVKHEMESAYELHVPLVVDVKSGPTWGDAH